MYVPALHYLIPAITFCTDITLCCIKDACVDMSLDAGSRSFKMRRHKQN